MKKIGRGRDYKKALFKNLEKALLTHKKIKTTLSKGKKLKPMFLKKHGGEIKINKIGERLGDNTAQVILQWLRKEEKKDENKTDKKKSDRKKVASNRS